MVAAITESDNAAAEAIWEGLGDPATAAADVGKVLHDTGDPTTVESRKLRPEYTAFGQTDWSLTNQAKFLSAAACDPRNQTGAGPDGPGDWRSAFGVLDLLPDAKIKGGWGPSPSGRYLVRQIGVVPAGQRGLTVVAMAAEPDSGSFADGTHALSSDRRVAACSLGHVTGSEVPRLRQPQYRYTTASLPPRQVIQLSEPSAMHCRTKLLPSQTALPSTRAAVDRPRG